MRRFRSLEEGESVPRPSRTGPSHGRLAGMAAVAWFALGGCVPPPLPPPSLGTFASSGGALGAWSTDAYVCSASVGESPIGTTMTVSFTHGREGRGGKWVHDTTFRFSVGEEAGALRLVTVERTGPDRQVQIKPETCTRSEVQLESQPDGSVAATIDLDCDSGDGGRLTASIHAPRCT